MSRRRKNNHYHYAQKFTDRSRKKEMSAALRLPRRAVFFAVLVLLAFGIVSTTFSVDNSSSATSEKDGSIMVSVRNSKVSRDAELTGTPVPAKKNTEIAETGYSLGHTDYYVIGNGSAGSWGTWNPMTKSPTGYYSSFYCANDTSFKVSKSASYNDAFYNFAYSFWGNTSIRTTSGYFNQGNDTNANGTNDFWIKGGNYIVVWYPNSDLHQSDTPLITAFSSLPTGPKYQVHYSDGTNWLDEEMTTSASPITESSTWTATVSGLAGNGVYQMCVQKLFSDYPNRSTITFQRGSSHDVYYNTGAWTWGNESSDNTDLYLHTVIDGNYTFTLNSTQWRDEKISLTVGFPSYTVRTSVAADNGTTSNTASPASTTVAIGSSVTISATDTDAAYEWSKWTVTSGTAKTGSYTGTAIGNSGNTTRTNLTIYPSGTSATVNLQANYTIRNYTITYSKGTDPGSASINGTISSGTKNYGQAFTLTSSKFTRTGYEQVGWSETENATAVDYASGGTIPAGTNSNVTLYPVWQLNTPTAKLNGGTIVAGSGDTIDLLNVSPSAFSTKGDNVTREVEYTITGPAVNDAAITNGSGGAYTESAAVFSATTPGTYTISATVTDQTTLGVTNINSTASVTTSSLTTPATSATIYVQPQAPSFTFVIDGYGDGDGSVATPYKVFMGTDYGFVAEVSSPIAGYTYEWSFDSNFSTIFATGSTLCFNDNDPRDHTNDPDDPNYNLTPATTPTVNTEILTLYCRAECNGQYQSGGSKTINYAIEPLVDNFTFVPPQKIYQSNDADVSLTAKYNMPGGNAQGFTTDLFFSHNHFDYSTRAQRVQNDLMTDFTDTIRNYFLHSGPKYFFMHIFANVNSRDIFSDSYIHTTVGTKETNAKKQLYFYNKTSTDFHERQVMCYWINSNGTYGYQIAQDLYKDDANKRGKTYRVNIPASATKVQFAMFKKDPDERFFYYPTPTLSDGTFQFDYRYYWGFTNPVTLSDSTRVIQTTSSAPTTDSQTIDGEIHSVYQYTGCTGAAFTTNN